MKNTKCKNTQKLEQALKPFNLTIDEAKQWLRDLQAVEEATDSFESWWKSHERAYSSKVDEKELCDDLFAKCDSAKDTAECSAGSNVTFSLGDANNKAKLCVDGVQVTGEFNASYMYSTNNSQPMLQVEFVNPKLISRQECSKSCSR